MLLYVKLIISSLLWAVISSQEFPAIQTPLGHLKGSYAKSSIGRDYMEFLGIPFALPPVENLRFADPVEFGNWSGTLNANISYICAQVSRTSKSDGGLFVGVEDCLYLNIFVPGKNIDLTKKLDVIFMIHGGGFAYGSAHTSRPTFLMDRDIVLVTFNYRLGVLGFMSTEDDNMPGNLGMKDQVMALSWTNKYIEYFGGNKKSITISGLSSGGVSVDFLMMSPLSEGLFHKGISLSGTSLMPWAIQDKPLQKIQRMAKVLNCTQKSTKELVRCLKLQPLQQLVESIRVLQILYGRFSSVGVVVDSASSNPFLLEHPYHLLEKGYVHDVPWITSVVTSEGFNPGAKLLSNPDYLPDLNKNWLNYAPSILLYQDIHVTRRNKVSKLIRDYYLGDEVISNKTFGNVIQAIGDRLYVSGAELSARMHAVATTSNVYFYQFDYIGEDRISLTSINNGIIKKIGVSHGDDFLYIAPRREEMLPIKLSQRDEAVQKLLLDMWTSFASTGVPSPSTWMPMSKDEKNSLRYLRIGRDGKYEMAYARELGNRRFFNELLFVESCHCCKAVGYYGF